MCLVCSAKRLEEEKVIVDLVKYVQRLKTVWPIVAENMEGK